VLDNLGISAQELATYVVPVFLVILGAAGWFIRRKITGAETVEKLDLAAKLLDVRSKLLAPDLTDGQIGNILATAGIERSLVPETQGSAAVNFDHDDGEPPILSTTAAMRVRLHARLKVLDAQIEQKIIDVEILSKHNASLDDLNRSSYDENHVSKMHRAWQLYRRRAGASVMYDYFGGTMAGPMFLAEEIRISEAFLAELDERFIALRI
jgi:hypothetical protein